jgi:hypothetical protein
VGTTKVTNSLLVIIALTLIWIALKPNGGAILGTTAVVRTAAAQTELDNDFDSAEEAPLKAICTLRAVDEAAARALVGELQDQVVTALNQTNNTLWNMQGKVADLPLLLHQMEGALQNIAKNTSSYQ